MAPRAIFRFDASHAIGGGHAYRCLTLARALADVGWEIIVAARPETFAIVPIASDFLSMVIECPEGEEAATIGTGIVSADLLVIDHYFRDAVFERCARSWAQRILVIDDLADRPHDCDFLLDQTYGRHAQDYRGLVPPFCTLLMGPDYALLRPQFFSERVGALQRRRVSKVEKILVSMGATDSDNLSSIVLEGIAQTELKACVDVVLGATAPYLSTVRSQAAAMKQNVRVFVGVANMASLMASADLAVGTGGVTSWERCCLGLPTLLAVVADNQRLIASGLEKSGAVVVVTDNLSTVIGETLTSLAGSPERLRSMALAAANICDGQGTGRVTQKVLQ